MKFLTQFGRFWYDFIIGDDPKIAIAVVLALGALGALVVGDTFGDHGLALLGGLMVVAFFAVSLALDARTKKR